MAVWLSRRGAPDVSGNVPWSASGRPAVRGRGRRPDRRGNWPWPDLSLAVWRIASAPPKMSLKKWCHFANMPNRSTPFFRTAWIWGKFLNLVLVRRPQGFNCMVKCTKPAEQALWALEWQSPRVRVIKSWKFLVAKKSPETSTIYLISVTLNK